AVGDCAGYWQLAHTGFREGEVAAENAMGHEAVVDNRGVPRPIYTDPEIAGVGLTEAEAREQYGDDVSVGVFPWVANARAVMQNETTGWVKSIHETRYGELLGIVMACPHAPSPERPFAPQAPPLGRPGVRAAVPPPRARRLPVRARPPDEPGRRGGRHPDDVPQRLPRAPTRRPPAPPAQLADRDRAQRLPHALAPGRPPPARGRARRRAGAGRPGTRPAERRRRAPRALPPLLQPAVGPGDARARGPQLQGDRRDARAFGQRGRGAPVPRAPAPPGRAKGPRRP